MIKYGGRADGFGEYLIEHELLTRQDLETGLAVQKETGEKLGEIFCRMGFLAKSQLNQLLSEYLGIEQLFLNEVILDPMIVQKVPEELARRHILIPVSLDAGILRVALSDPSNVRAIDDVRIYTGYVIEPVMAEKEDILAAIRQYLTVWRSVAQLSESSGVSEDSGIWNVGISTDYSDQDGPTVQLVDFLLQQAIAQGASDIHWEPREKNFLVRFRIDGKLGLVQQMSLSGSRSMISRLKVMARLDVSERRLPQDGHIAIAVAEKRIDLRVSTLPTVYGEKIVVRILNSDTARRSFDELGMQKKVKKGIRAVLEKPHGLILVVGPTGSGKTTTLYALLQEIDAETLNIVSIEDPVEYQLPGVNQVQVNSHSGLNFVRGLRSILRQDPDVIMIGEIRDEETARIAISAALTGHLVLSTLHTNTAAEALTRLLDMGIEPYLLAAVINGILSQRLVRLLCSRCKTAFNPSENEKELFNIPAEVQTLYKATTGCTHCRGTGYKGRIGIHEFMPYNQDIKELILSSPSSQAIERSAIKAGMDTLLQDGLSKAFLGYTTIEEVLSSVTAF